MSIKFIFRLIVFSFVFLASPVVFSQTQNIFGANLTTEFSGHWEECNLRFGAGFSFEHKLTKHSGLETGCNYRSDVDTRFIELNYGTGTLSYVSKIKEHYVSIPLLYKYYSKLINVAAGVTADYFVGWSDLSANPEIKTTSYKVSPSLYWGIMTKISKTINLKPNMFLEPEIRYNFMTHNKRYYGLGLGLKYVL